MRDEILYLGPFNPEDVVKRRRLPARNPAAYNRMLRLAKAVRHTGRNIRIISTGISLRVGLHRAVWHREEECVVEDVVVSLLPAVGFPVIGFLAEPLILLVWLSSRFLRHRPSALMVYNATIASAMAVALASLFRIPVIYEVEDVPAWSVARGAQTAEKPRLFQNLSWIVASSVQRPLSKRVLVPSKRFLDALNLSDWQRKSALVISGCVEVATTATRMESFLREDRPLKILFAGKLEAEHGYDLLLGAISELQAEDADLAAFEFHICGLPRRGDAAFLPPPAHHNVHYHGFVSDKQYKDLLADCDIGLALQKSNGIFRDTRTPSKAYEFLASGKLLIATNVGDLDDLFPHSAICLGTETSRDLADLLRSIAALPEEYVAIAHRGLEFAHQEFSFQAVGRTLTANLKTA